GLPRENYANHPQLFPLFFPAVAIWAAIEVFRQPPRRERVWLAILFAALTLQLYTAFYTAWFTGFSLGVAALIATALPASRERLREVLRNQWKTLLVCASVSAIVVAPLAIHY